MTTIYSGHGSHVDTPLMGFGMTMLLLLCDGQFAC
jgi:hypothetical protein